MASPALTWTINAERGSVNFGRTIPFAGNTYDLTISGGDVGETYKAFLMSDNGLECLAQSATSGGSTTIALNTQGVWDSFVREPHELKAFHLIIRDSAKSVAEGDLSIMWNPLWTDVTSSAVYSMRGPKGDTGATGPSGATGAAGKSAYTIAVENGYSGTQAEWLQSLKGPPGPLTMAYCEDDGEWYGISIGENTYGDKVLKVDQDGRGYDPDTSAYVLRTEDQGIYGTKTFNAIPVVKQIGIELDSTPATDNEQTIHKVVDVDGAVLVEDTFKHDSSNGFHAFVGRIKRTISGVAKWCGIETKIDSTGVRTINLQNADNVLVPTAQSGDSTTNAASTAFVSAAIAACTTFVTMKEFSGLTGFVTTKTISGLTASKTYKVLLLWAMDGGSQGPTIDETIYSSGEGLFCTTLEKTANTSGEITFNIKVYNTAYLNSVVAIVITN